MPLNLIQGPLAEPITLDEAKLHLKVDISDDDDLIQSLITVSREYAEMKCGRSFVFTTWEYILDSFPGPSRMGVPYGKPFTLPGHAVIIPKAGVKEITSFRYRDMNREWRDVTQDTLIEISYGDDITRITPQFGQIWPIPLPEIGSVRIRFTSGYGQCMVAVPDGIKAWMKLRIGSLYQNREEIAIVNRGRVVELPYVDYLLDPYRVVNI